MTGPVVFVIASAAAARAASLGEVADSTNLLSEVGSSFDTARMLTEGGGPSQPTMCDVAIRIFFNVTSDDEVCREAGGTCPMSCRVEVESVLASCQGGNTTTRMGPAPFQPGDFAAFVAGALEGECKEAPIDAVFGSGAHAPTCQDALLLLASPLNVCGGRTGFINRSAACPQVCERVMDEAFNRCTSADEATMFGVTLSAAQIAEELETVFYSPQCIELQRTKVFRDPNATDTETNSTTTAATSSETATATDSTTTATTATTGTRTSTETVAVRDVTTAMMASIRPSTTTVAIADGTTATMAGETPVRVGGSTTTMEGDPRMGGGMSTSSSGRDSTSSEPSTSGASISSDSEDSTTSSSRSRAVLSLFAVVPCAALAWGAL